MSSVCLAPFQIHDSHQLRKFNQSFPVDQTSHRCLSVLLLLAADLSLTCLASPYPLHLSQLPLFTLGNTPLHLSSRPPPGGLADCCNELKKVEDWKARVLSVSPLTLLTSRAACSRHESRDSARRLFLVSLSPSGCLTESLPPSRPHARHHKPLFD